LGLLDRWPDLERKLPANAKMPWDRESLTRRYETNSIAQLTAFHSKKFQDKRRPKIEKMMALYRDPQLPEQFRGLPSRQVWDFNWTTFPCWPCSLQLEADSDAAGGYAIPSNNYSDALVFGIGINPFEQAPGEKAVAYSMSRLKPVEAPQDGKYHLYKIGRANVGKYTVISACGNEIPIGRAYNPESGDNQWDCYVSMRVTGPAYIKGSTGTNSAWLDRILLVKPQESSAGG